MPRSTIAALAILLVTLGCSSGPKMYRVTGEATFDGEPVDNGEILLLAVDKRVSPDAGRIEKGKFDFLAKPGIKRVEIRATKQIGTSAMGPIMKEYVPIQFNGESTLQEEVKEIPENRFTFTLTSKKK
jgi:hypothetical protein